MYKRLTLEEREQIAIGLVKELSLSEIARQLKRHKTSISREVKKFSVEGQYLASQANEFSSLIKAVKYKRPKKLDQDPVLRQFVFTKLKRHWSPKQISKVKDISHETIYKYIFAMPRGAFKKEILSCLREKRSQRRPRTFLKQSRASMMDMLLIDHRPEEVADRIVPGHWEGDLIIGKGHQSAIGTLVERKTRYCIIVPLASKDAKSVREAFAEELMRLPEHMRKTLTYDQGSEMAEHKQFTKDTKIQVYFCHPSSPWLRGTNENTNRLVRDFFPKGTDFTKVSYEQLKFAQEALNERPRETLAWKTPEQALLECCLTLR